MIVPPPLFVTAAVKITDVPAQIVPEGFAVIFTTGLMLGFTTIVMLLDVAVVGEAQAALEVRITFTISVLFKEAEVNVAAFVPVFIPLTCH